jgi:single-strand DNA-binding protein
MAETFVSITGNLTDDPELRFTQSGVPVANFRVAVTPRVPDGQGGFPDGETGFYRVTAWRSLAENIADSLAKGARVVVLGKLRTSTWETPEGEKRSSVEIQADEVAPSLRFATVTLQKPGRGAQRTPAAGGDQFNDPPPF